MLDSKSTEKCKITRHSSALLRWIWISSVSYLFCFFLFEKVAAVSGDARRCLDICRRAVEIADSQSKKKGTALVGMIHVDAALQDMFSSPKIRAMK